MTKTKQRERKGILAVNVGLAANTLLAAIKTWIGIVGHSPALLADGINSTADVAYGIVVNIFVRLAGKPPDAEHPYGHYQMESIAAVVVGSFVISTAIAIFWDAVNSVFNLLTKHTEATQALSIALWVALFTVVFKIGLAIWTNRVGNDIENAAVLALAYDHRNDVFSALAAALGIFFNRRGYLWVDPLAGAIVALVVLQSGIEILLDATSDLMDTVPGKNLAKRITELIGDIESIEQVEEIHAYRFGPYLVVNITIGVNGSMSVTKGDQIADQVERVLLDEIDFMRRVHVHYHPAAVKLDD
ncbi:MAG: cation diffusion facilitator family transporter [Chloroflexota bacterium]|nr:cation diffusion facilitator family transporter [Chloroflexota bacterium]